MIDEDDGVAIASIVDDEAMRAIFDEFWSRALREPLIEGFRMIKLGYAARGVERPARRALEQTDKMAADSEEKFAQLLRQFRSHSDLWEEPERETGAIELYHRAIACAIVYLLRTMWAGEIVSEMKFGRLSRDELHALAKRTREAWEAEKCADASPAPSSPDQVSK